MKYYLLKITLKNKMGVFESYHPIIFLSLALGGFMINFSGDFQQFFTKIGYFIEKQCYDQYLSQNRSILSRKMPICPPFFSSSRMLPKP
jgi:hypothetical protein